MTLAACSTGPSVESQGAVAAAPSAGKHLTIGSAGSTESELLARMYALLLGKAGYSTEILPFTSREMYEPALQSGRIDVVPEYAATFADWLNTKVNGPDAGTVASPDLARTMTALRKLATPRGLTVLGPGSAAHQYAFAVSASFARGLRLATLSDLGRTKLPVLLSADEECVRRPDCAPGLTTTYGIDITAVDPRGVGTTRAKQAVQSGRDQMLLTTTTDATLDDFGLALLADDKHLQNANYIVPVVNRADAGNTGVTRALGRLNTVLTTADLARLNEQVDSRGRPPQDVAREYLVSKELLRESGG
ncbi:ABC transporter substrate-binding protein [Streptomyces sp. SLBN-118]|uniref:ABC transporter substrate-binding protein n=1 Tax=Streptomyces sp. SLBN-118 TaxID=2768454 RepID=UPI00114E1799|nr:ABC transporter substrate-binding protein [Streptomyces sp. SLBN-118]